jgi:hypothetical protein
LIKGCQIPALGGDNPGRFNRNGTRLEGVLA